MNRGRTAPLSSVAHREARITPTFPLEDCVRPNKQVQGCGIPEVALSLQSDLKPQIPQLWIAALILHNVNFVQLKEMKSRFLEKKKKRKKGPTHPYLLPCDFGKQKLVRLFVYASCVLA